MILCLCQAVVDRTVGAAIAEGASTLDEIVAACAAGAGCGGCHPSLLALLAASSGPCAPSTPAIALTR
jgi:bacterioferritin-associated ferredoxin